jgi:hypothetical protein
MKPPEQTFGEALRELQPPEQPARKRPDLNRRDPGAPFDQLEREQYAKARAKGGSIKAACGVAGISPALGTQLERLPEMRKRISELRQGAEDFVGVSKGWCIRQLMINAEQSREDGAWKASNEAIGLIHKMISEDVDISHQMARALPPDVGPQELQKRLSTAFSAPKPPKLKAEYVPPPAPADDAEEQSE